MEITKRARRKHHFEVYEIKSEDFLSYRELTKMIVNRKIDMGGQKVDWMKIRSVKLDKQQPYTILYTTDSDEYAEYRMVNIEKKATSCQSPELHAVTLPVLYPDGRVISKAKWLDIISLMKYIPPQFHGFYESLKHDSADATNGVDVVDERCDFCDNNADQTV